jgi:hypothetical protein
MLENNEKFTGLGNLLHKPILIQTLTHDGYYELISGTLEFFHLASKQFYLSDFKIWICNIKDNTKKFLYSGDLCMIVEKTIFTIMLNPSKEEKN